jgi:hypothetical protein
MDVDGMVELEGLGLSGIKQLRKDEPSESQGRNQSGKEINKAASEGLRHEIGVVGKHGIDEENEPSLLRGLFRGMRLMFHGVDPSLTKVERFRVQRSGLKNVKTSAFIGFGYPSAFGGMRAPKGRCIKSAKSDLMER